MRNKILQEFSLFAELSKIKIPLAVTVSALTGYLVYKEMLDMTAFFLIGGVFLLSSGSAALNQLQEHRYDALMARTRNRPIPSGRFSTKGTFIFSTLLISVGTILLFAGTNLTATIIGLVTLGWYNGLYTHLKRKTVFAILAGAFVGAFPPMIGWTAAGGHLSDPVILLIASLLFIWQVPHFILLLLKYGKDYEIAGFASLTTIFTQNGLKQLIFIWILATACAVVIIPVAGVISSQIIVLALLLSSVWLVVSFYYILRKQSVNLKMAFMQMNIFLLLVLVLFSVDSLI
jgi:protoheme IX farnesyltransferase